MLVERDRLMISVIVGMRTDERCFRREAGIGSKSQLVSEESVSRPSKGAGINSQTLMSAPMRVSSFTVFVY